MTVRSSERDLLAACRKGSIDAIAPLIDLHVGAGVRLALQRATSSMSDDELLDLVHDAFLTAFDEALESDAGSLRTVFHDLIRLFVDRGEPRCAAPINDSAVSPRSVQDLRTDLIQEARMMIELYALTPPRGSARGVRKAINMLGKGLQHRVELFRTCLSTIAINHGARR